MEKVICKRCGSICFTASPEHVNCSECGGKHKVINSKYANGKYLKKSNTILTLPSEGIVF